jgi:hypothetical protein
MCHPHGPSTILRETQKRLANDPWRPDAHATILLKLFGFVSLNRAGWKGPTAIPKRAHACIVTNTWESCPAVTCKPPSTHDCLSRTIGSAAVRMYFFIFFYSKRLIRLLISWFPADESIIPELKQNSKSYLHRLCSVSAPATLQVRSWPPLNKPQAARQHGQNKKMLKTPCKRPNQPY